MVHKLRPTGQMRPATSRQVARKVQQKSLKCEKYEKIWHMIHCLAVGLPSQEREEEEMKEQERERVGVVGAGAREGGRDGGGGAVGRGVGAGAGEGV